MTQTTPVIELRNLTKSFKRQGISFRAVDDISLSINAGETLALIGESGSGKSTTGRLILGLDKPDSGDVLFHGESLQTKSAKEVRRLRSHLTVVFQEPFESLNPRLRIGAIVEEPLVVQGVGSAEERRERAAGALERVGLTASMMGRFPRELSGGQQQRVGIARAIIGKPQMIVLDEPTASLDRTIRRQIGDVLDELKQDLNLAYLLITHDIGTVRQVSNRSAVMLQGKIVEIGPTAEITEDPQHPYTERLIGAELPVSVAKPRRTRIQTKEAAL